MTTYSEEAARLRAIPLDQLCGKDRKLKLMIEHPETGPDISEPLPYLIDAPSYRGRTPSFERFRAELITLIQSRPEDRHYPLFLACVERVLAWRATVAPEDRFWREP